MLNWLSPDAVRGQAEEAHALQGRLLPPSDPALEACFQLRHAYFVQERGWVKDNTQTPGAERDGYDPHCLHFGVWDEDGVVAYLRVLPFHPGVGFMLDRELSCLLLDEERQTLPRENAVELSRLVVRPNVILCANPNQAHPVELLLRELYRVSKERDFTRFYIVVEQSWLGPFARRFGLRFQTVGTPHLFPDGTETVAATATLDELEAGMRRHSAAKFQWYQQDRAPEK